MMAFLDMLFKQKPKNKIQKNVVHTLQEVKTTAPITKSMSYQIANLQGIGARERQEDSFSFVNAMDVTEIRKHGLLAILADGMGGMENGKMASELAISVFKKEFSGFNYKEDLCQQIKDSIKKAGEKVHFAFEGKSGSTAIACLFYEEKLYFASIGDSSLYLKRGNKLIQLNREQSYKEHLLRKMVLKPHWDIESAKDDDEADCLMEFLGKEDMGEPDYLVIPFSLEDGDQVILCSDGVSKVLSRSEMIECLYAEDVGEACDRVEQAILQKGMLTQDNYTMILVSCGF